MHGMITEQVELFEYFGCEISPRSNDGKFNAFRLYHVGHTLYHVGHTFRTNEIKSNQLYSPSDKQLYVYFIIILLLAISLGLERPPSG